MKASIAALTSIVALASAAPPGFPPRPWCDLSEDTAAALVDGFGSLLTTFTTDNANKFLHASNFTDTSSSINFLTGQPLDGITFPNRDAFIAGQGAQPPIGFEVLGIDAVACKAPGDGVVAFRWKATVGGNQTGGAKGINVLYVTKEGVLEGQGVEGWVIESVFSEFNNAVWVQEFGGSCEVAAPPPAS
ncbi:uncharacterized protein HMPREF1541_07211 [Cyphellophora europaea CBS 101466]|uniref:NTF2-like domain-containing protein n=1 Tax=Cyphellophora europaea (strain CBS 101466) TaxID=1220924 RepID=W2RPD6_CYPE1|nr:uncharacterized protein HMPREF1541_07211 [Cyphellophora europaea CBS 101466]ETN37589.1 hypothetical protein HMPREF1541_07211 [Cyphellophora europaea CBS 101466]